MILIGRNLSPYTRRVAVTMKLLGLAFERQMLSTLDHGEQIRARNPLGRVPVLVLDDGEALIESGAILDYLDERAGPERALTPPKGAERRRVLHLAALATGACDKGVATAYERQRRPADKIHPPWAEKCEGQAKAGLAALEQETGAGWLVGGRLTQADISAVCALDFINAMLPGLLEMSAYPKLAALSARANALEAFASTHPSKT